MDESPDDGAGPRSRSIRSLRSATSLASRPSRQPQANVAANLALLPFAVRETNAWMIFLSAHDTSGFICTKR